jgi:hypothetical protein
VGSEHRSLGRTGHPSDINGMTSSASTAAWLPAAIARAAVITPSAHAVRPGGRHSAPETPGLVEIVAAGQARPGRHAEPEWSRELHDPRRDEVDSFAWLGFAPRT